MLLLNRKLILHRKLIAYIYTAVFAIVVALLKLLFLQKRNTQRVTQPVKSTNNRASNKAFVYWRKKRKTQLEPKMVDSENEIKVQSGITITAARTHIHTRSGTQWIENEVGPLLFSCHRKLLP